ncbi:hypothetical protein ABBQ38_014367 [Trebouxia sp. C0009 RCD-2024]
MVQETKTVKQTHIELGHPLQGIEAHPKRSKTKWDVESIIVANDKGLYQFVRQGNKGRLLKATQNREDEATRIHNMSKNNGVTSRLQRSLRGLHTPSKFNKVSCKHRKNWRTTNATGLDGRLRRVRECFCNSSFRLQWQGSIIERYATDVVNHVSGSRPALHRFFDQLTAATARTVATLLQLGNRQVRRAVEQVQLVQQ